MVDAGMFMPEAVIVIVPSLAGCVIVIVEAGTMTPGSVMVFVELLRTVRVDAEAVMVSVT